MASWQQSHVSKFISWQLFTSWFGKYCNESTTCDLNMPSLRIHLQQGRSIVDAFILLLRTRRKSSPNHTILLSHVVFPIVIIETPIAVNKYRYDSSVSYFIILYLVYMMNRHQYLVLTTLIQFVLFLSWDVVTFYSALCAGNSYVTCEFPSQRPVLPEQTRPHTF